MPSTLTGVGASAAQSTSPTASAPADGDSLAASGVQSPIQTILNHIAKLWAGAFAGQTTTSPGVTGTGGATAPGVAAVAGGGGTPARGALALTPQAAPSAPTDGDVWIETTSNQVKARVAGATQILTPSAVIPIRAWAKITVGAAGAATVVAGSGVASASWVTSDLTVVFSPAMPSANYTALGVQTSNTQTFVTPNGYSTTQVTFTSVRGTANVTFTGGGEEIRIAIIGG